MSIADIYDNDVITIMPQENVRAVANLMKEKNVEAVVIIENSRPSGILTNQDIISRILLDGEATLDSTVEDIMNTDLLIVYENAELKEVLKIMCEKGAKNVPVVAGDGKLRGFASLNSLIMLIAKEFHDLTQLFKINL